LARSGFRRYATYRQATVAGAVTNTVFGLLRCYVLLAVAAGAGGLAAGYDSAQLATYVWVGQGLLAVVMLWGWSDLADRIRTGAVATDHQARLLSLEAGDDSLANALGGTGDDHDFVLQSLAVSRLGHRR
jgi:ABC-type uncharacterized transport system permease subunit